MQGFEVHIKNITPETFGFYQRYCPKGSATTRVYLIKGDRWWARVFDESLERLQDIINEGVKCFR